MTFTEPFFLLVFLPAGMLAFHLVGRFGRDAALAALLFLSILFYLPWGFGSTALLLGSITVNFLAGSLLLAMSDKQEAVRRWILTAGLLFNLVLLVWFKYRGISGLSSPADGAAEVAVRIPAGISFYTFHQAAFLVDAFSRERHVLAWLSRAQGLRSAGIRFLRYGSFVSFFPQLVIGPITYLREFQPQTQLGSFGRLRRIDFAVGMALIAIGLFKKLVIADALAPGADSVFLAASLGEPLDSLGALAGVGFFYLQLYFDFSGYSDIALGLGRIFGIRYPINFDSPLRANGIIDWYRRWHMTLTRVISRFLFTPLSILGARLAIRRRYTGAFAKLLGLWLPLLINFEVIGLWHGAVWTFVAFGIAHGLWYIVETEVRRTRKWRVWRDRVPVWRRWLYGHAILLALMPLSFALFRADSLETFVRLVLAIVIPDFSAPTHDAIFSALPIAVLGTLIVYLMPNSIELLSRLRPGIVTYQNPSTTPQPFARLRWRPDWAGSLFVAAILMCALWFLSRQAPFLYEGF